MRILAIVGKWLSVGSFLALLLGLLIISTTGHYGPACTTKVVDSQSALAKSDDDIQASVNSDQTAKCAAYRRRVDILTTASAVAETCGPPQATRGGAGSSSLFAELGFYKQRVNEQCR